MRRMMLLSATMLSLAGGAALAQNAPTTTTTPPPAPPSSTPAVGTPSAPAAPSVPARQAPVGTTPQPGQAPAPSAGSPSPSPRPGSTVTTPQAAAPAPTPAPSATAAPATAPSTTAPSTTATAKPHPIMRHHRVMKRATPAADSSESGTTGADTGTFAHEPGTGVSGPPSAQASNITGADTRSTIAPHLPPPAGGENATASTYLQDAQRALQARQTGRAQEALERAETYLLTRSVPAADGTPVDNGPVVTQIATARKALGNRDMAGAQTAITAALQAAPR